MRLRGRRLQQIRHRIRQEQPFCVECLAEGKLKAWDELDHIIPIHKGGTNARHNLVGLCRAHHNAKTAQDMGFKQQACDVDGVPLDKSHHWNVG